MNLQKKLFLLFALLMTMFMTACKVTPHANVGVDLTMQNGKLKMRPNANVGVYGHP